MAEPALQTLYKALAHRLSSPAEPWGTKVRVSLVKAGTGYPYVVQYWSGGGEVQINGYRHAELRIGVKCVSDKLAEAMGGAGRITALLREKGKQTSPSDYLYGSADWTILTATEEEAIYLDEAAPDTIPVYHVGAFYRFFMQET